MKSYLVLLLLFSSMLTFSACNDDSTCEFHFVTTESAANEKWTLWLDGQNLGILPNPEQEATCENTNGALDSLIHATLDGSRHNFEAIDSLGVVRSKGYFKTTETKSSAGGNVGGSSTNGSCDCQIFTIFD